MVNCSVTWPALASQIVGIIEMNRKHGQTIAYDDLFADTNVIIAVSCMNETHIQISHIVKVDFLTDSVRLQHAATIRRP